MASTKAQIAKDKGNNAFKAGNWAEAIGHYSEAVIADRTNPTFPLNRAAAYLKLSKFQDADRDCTTVLSLDPKNVKAFFRRAQARSALGRYSEAENDLLHASKLEPANDSIQSELSSVRNRSAAQSERDKKSKSKQAASLPPSSVPSSTKRRVVRNVPIEIVESDQEIIPTNGETISDITQPISLSPSPSSQRTPPDLLTKVQSRTLSSSQDTPARSVSSSSTSASAFASPSSLPLSSQIPSPPPPVTSPNPPPKPKPSPRVGAGLFRANGSFTILRSLDSPSPSPSSTPTPPTSASTSTLISTPIISSQDIPQTHFAFSRRWNNLSTSQERLSLIQLIPPESLPTLFKNNLAPELLISILQTFLDTSSASPDHNALILSYMSIIPNISRFDTVVLFFSAKEREIVTSLWDNIDPDKTSEYRVLWGAGSA